MAVSPQAGHPRAHSWDPSLIVQLLDSILKEYGANIDKNRVYLTGKWYYSNISIILFFLLKSYFYRT